MSPEGILSIIAKQANINPDRALIIVRVLKDEDFVANYGNEAWGVINLTISESTKEHIEEGE